MTLTEKIEVLDNYLVQPSQNYRDSFKTDTYLFFYEEFTPKNSYQKFLNNLDSHSEIKKWVDYVTSQIVLKIVEGEEELGVLISEFVEHN